MTEKTTLAALRLNVGLECELYTLAQDAGFIVNALGEICTPAPTTDATKCLKKFLILARAKRKPSNV